MSEPDTAYWALEIERDDMPPRYIAVEAFEADGESITAYTPDGDEIVFDRSAVRKVLVMRTAVTTGT